MFMESLMALDDLLTKTVAIAATGTFYPVGSMQVGDAANFDEFDFFTGNKGTMDRGMALVAFVPQADGDLPTLAVTFETDDNVAFSSAQTRMTGRTITAAGKYLIGYVGNYPERYGRVKCVAGGTSPDFGTVTFALVPVANNIFYN